MSAQHRYAALQKWAKYDSREGHAKARREGYAGDRTSDDPAEQVGRYWYDQTDATRLASLDLRRDALGLFGSARPIACDPAMFRFAVWQSRVVVDAWVNLDAPPMIATNPPHQ